MSEEYCYKYMVDQCGRTWPPTRFEDICSDVNDFCQSCFDYKLLEFVIDKCSCSTALKNDIQEYSKEIGEFKCRVTVSKYYSNSELCGPPVHNRNYQYYFTFA